MSDVNYLELLEKAQSSQHGLKIKTDNTAELRKRLHMELLSLEEDSPLAGLCFRISPTDQNELWIIKPKKEQPA